MSSFDGFNRPHPDAERLERQATALQQSLEMHSNDISEAANYYAEGTDRIVGDFQLAYLEDPDDAIARIPAVLEQFAAVNNNPDLDFGILNHTTDEQFGKIFNIAAGNYGDEPDTRQIDILRQVHNFLRDRNSMNIPWFTAKLSNPDLLHDLVAHSGLYYPEFSAYTEFTAQADFAAIEATMNNYEDNPLMLAMAVPRATTPAEIRQAFAEQYPVLQNKALDVIAASIITDGGAQEMLTELFGRPDDRLPWEEAMIAELKRYGTEIQPELVHKIMHPRNIEYVDDYSPPQLLAKLRTTRFTIAGSQFRRHQKPLD